MDIDFTQYDPQDSGDYEELMEIITDNPGEEYDWAKLADYGIEYAWMQDRKSTRLNSSHVD